jgi:GNAT superfamily N-acetyltransferase
VIQVLGPEDKEWVLKIWAAEAAVLGVDPGLIWYRAWKDKAPNEHWIGISNIAFAHYRIRQRDGVRVLYEVAVAASSKRQGLGQELLKAIGYPMELKTDAGHAESNAFYVKLGFSLLGQRPTKSGNKLLNVYRRVR